MITHKANFSLHASCLSFVPIRPHDLKQIGAKHHEEHQTQHNHLLRSGVVGGISGGGITFLGFESTAAALGKWPVSTSV